MLAKIATSLMAVFVVAGCATNFTGDPHIEEGRGGCEAKCKGQGMALAGMVFMGEYTSGCVCTVPGQTASRDQLLAAAQAGAGAGAAGVVMQMRAQAQRQNRGY